MLKRRIVDRFMLRPKWESYGGPHSHARYGYKKECVKSRALKSRRMDNEKYHHLFLDVGSFVSRWRNHGHQADAEGQQEDAVETR